MGEPKRVRATPVGVDLAELRQRRLAYVADPALGEQYLSPLRGYRRWLEALALSDPQALDQPEEVLVVAFINQQSENGMAAATIDSTIAAIRWWARRERRHDAVAALDLKDLRNAVRRDAPSPAPMATELDLDEVRAILDQLTPDLYPNAGTDTDALVARDRAMFLAMLHLGARYSDAARLDLIDIARVDGCWSVTPWVRKDWPGGTPDGLWLVPTRDPAFDPVIALDVWMEFRAARGDGPLFTAHTRGRWQTAKPVSYGVQYRRLRAAAARAEVVQPPGTHSFRRTLTQLLDRQGVTDADLVGLLGLRDTRTLETYLRRTRSGNNAAVQIVRHEQGTPT